MKNHIIFFSGGKSSFAVAHLIKEKNPNDNILLYFNDTLWEDEDLYRFIYEASDKLKLPMLIHGEGRTPLEIMEKDNFLYNSRVANCSLILKARVAKRYLKKGEKPKIEKWHNKQYLKNENFRDNPILYFGISFTEIHRKEAIVRNWKPFDVEMPLITEYVDVDKLLYEYKIEIPRLYKMGFAHNNCKGRCIKGGQGHWIHLLKNDYKSFSEMRDFELKMNEQINNYKNTKNVKYSFLKKKGKPYWLKELEEDFRSKPQQLDIFDFGGCGCFIDEDASET
jgi:hypothetical protein